MKTALAEPEIVTRRGKPVSIILPIKACEALLERLEDAEDVAYLKKAVRHPQDQRPGQSGDSRRQSAAPPGRKRIRTASLWLRFSFAPEDRVHFDAVFGVNRLVADAAGDFGAPALLWRLLPVPGKIICHNSPAFGY